MPLTSFFRARSSPLGSGIVECVIIPINRLIVCFHDGAEQAARQRVLCFFPLPIYRMNPLVCLFRNIDEIVRQKPHARIFVRWIDMVHELTRYDSPRGCKNPLIASVGSRLDGLSKLAPHYRIVERTDFLASSFALVFLARSVHAVALLSLLDLSAAAQANVCQHKKPSLGFLSVSFLGQALSRSMSI